MVKLCRICRYVEELWSYDVTLAYYKCGGVTSSGTKRARGCPVTNGEHTTRRVGSTGCQRHGDGIALGVCCSLLNLSHHDTAPWSKQHAPEENMRYKL